MYRIKTYEEFGNKRPSGWNVEGAMDDLYGLLVSDEQAIEKCVPRKDGFGTWALILDNLVELKGFTEIPRDVKVGDKFIIVGKNGINSSNTLSSKLEFGSIVTLYKQDDSICPGFTWDALEDDYYYLDWGYMAHYYGSVNGEVIPKKAVKKDNLEFEDKPYPDEVEGTVYRVKSSEKLVSLKKNDGSRNPFFWNEDKSDFSCIFWHRLKRVEQPKLTPKLSSIDEKEKIIGNKYKVIKTTEEEYYQVNDIVEYKYDDGTESPKFLNTRTGKDVYINWKNLVIHSETNLNLNKDGKESNTIEFILSRISSTVSYGSTPRGVELQSTRSKILMGS